MAEVVDWAPVDDDNNSAPPVGAPEGMMPSAVNNTMRAMMGSLRRMYDKIVSAETVLPYLPLAGGTVTGSVAINGTGGVSLSGVQLRNISNGLEVYNASSGLVLSRGPTAGYQYGDRDQVSAQWTWYATGGLSYLHSAATGNVLNVTNAGALAVATSVDTPAYKIAGVTFVYRTPEGAHQLLDASGNLAIALFTNESYYRAGSHRWQNDAGTEVATLTSAGSLAVLQNIGAGGTVTGTTVTATGTVGAADASISNTVQANQLTSNANIDAVGDIDAGGTITGAAIVGNTVHANTTLSAGTSVAAPTITASGNMSAANLSTASSISAGTWVNAPQYRLGGVPIEFAALFDQMRDLQERVAALEAH